MIAMACKHKYKELGIFPETVETKGIKALINGKYITFPM